MIGESVEDRRSVELCGTVTIFAHVKWEWNIVKCEIARLVRSLSPQEQVLVGQQVKY